MRLFESDVDQHEVHRAASLVLRLTIRDIAPVQIKLGTRNVVFGFQDQTGLCWLI